MSQPALRVDTRPTSGGGASRSLRRSGLIPGVLYGGGSENALLQVDPRDILKGLNQPGFYTTIFEFTLNGKKERALCKEVQLHPVTDTPMHIDFMRVSKETKVHVGLPIRFINETLSPGIKQGGILNIVIHALDIVCFAESIPDALTIDLKGMEIGHSIHLADLSLPNGVKAAHPDRDNTIATIAAPAGQKDEESK